MLWIIFSIKILLSAQHFFLKSEVRDLYLKRSSGREEICLLMEEGVCMRVWMRVCPSRWVGRNNYLFQKGKAGSNVYLVPALSMTRPELN